MTYIHPLQILFVAFSVCFTDIRLQQRREEAEKNRSLDVLRAAVVCVLGHVDTGENWSQFIIMFCVQYLIICSHHMRTSL
jgi:hypothetical protein